MTKIISPSLSLASGQNEAKGQGTPRGEREQRKMRRKLFAPRTRRTTMTEEGGTEEAVGAPPSLVAATASQDN